VSATAHSIPAGGTMQGKQSFNTLDSNSSHHAKPILIFVDLLLFRMQRAISSKRHQENLFAPNTRIIFKGVLSAMAIEASATSSQCSPSNGRRTPSTSNQIY
jgi:hypothetical protein